MNTKGLFNFDMNEGRALRVMIAVVMAVLISLWGIVPSFNVYAETGDPQNTAQGTETGSEGSDTNTEDGTDGDGTAAPSDPGQQSNGGAGEGEDPQEASPAETQKAPTDGVAMIGDVAFATLQEAVDAAEAGDTIRLTKDITEYVTISGKKITIDLGGKTVRAADNGSNRNSFLISDSSEVEIKNGTITGGSSKAWDDKGGFHVENAKATITDISFTGNSGKVVRANESTLNIYNCLFTGNDNDDSASNAYMLASHGKTTRIYVENTQFRDNVYSGGDIIATISANSIELKSCDIVNNRAKEMVRLYNNGTITLRDTTIKNNVGTGETGGVYIHSGSFYMYDSAVYSNECSGSSYGNDFSVIYDWLDNGEIPLPQDMKDHGIPLTGYEMVAPRYGKVLDKPVSKANSATSERELSIEPIVDNGMIAEFDGVQYPTIADAVAAMNGQAGTVKVLKDVTIAETIEGFDGLVIDLDGHTLKGKGNKRDTIRINGGNVTVKNGTFADSNASTSAALRFQEGSGSVENVRFENNAGNGLYVYHNIKYKATVDETPVKVTVKDCEFIENGHKGEVYAMSVIGASIDVSDSSFKDNYRGFRYAQSNILDNPPVVNIQSTPFTGHSGSVLEIYTAMNTDVNLTDCDIKDNHITNGDKYLINLREVDHFSGSPQISGGDVNLTDCEISGNDGAISTINMEAGRKSLTNCLISGNEAKEAGAIDASPMTYLVMRDTVIKDNHVTGLDDVVSSGGIKTWAAKYTRISMGMSGGVLVVGLNPQDMGYFACNVDIEGGAIYNNTNDRENPENAANDVFVQDGDGIIYLPVYEEMTDGDHDFSTHQYNPSDVIIIRSSITPEAVFIDPVNGDDKNKGDNPQRPVKTWNRATGLLDRYDAKRINVMDTIQFDEDITVDLGGKEVCRYSEFEGQIFRVNEGCMTIGNTVINGKENSATDSLVRVESEGSLILKDGAKLINNGKYPDDFADKGGAVYSEGDLTIEDGVLISNNAARQGGAIYMSGGTLTMTGGVIDNNRAFFKSNDGITYIRESDGKEAQRAGTNYGGGVLLVKGATMDMTGGEITNNKCRTGGGGIAIGVDIDDVRDWTTTLNMSGGTVSNNEAFGTGGGINVQCNCVANITGGNITDNTAKSNEAAFAGGGIYVNGYHRDDAEKVGVRNGILNIYDLELGNNTAAVEGGAIAWCGAGSGGVYESRGLVVYDNRSLDQDVSSTNFEELNRILGSVDYEVKKSDILFSDVYFKHVGTDEKGRPKWEASRLSEFRQATFLSENMLNGAPFNWKDDEGNVVDVETLRSNYHVTRFSTDATATDKDVEESIALAKVHITGNYSGTSGGGIGCNGDVFIGITPPQVEGAEEEPTPPEVKGVEEEPTKTAKAKVKGKQSSPRGTNTGDEFRLVSLVILMMMAAAAAGAVAYRRRRMQ